MSGVFRRNTLRGIFFFTLLTLLTSGAMAISISITSPTNNQSVTTGSNLTITVSISGGTASQVTYWYDNWTWLANVSSSPYSYTWNNVPSGTHTIKAKVTGTDNSTAYAQEITIIVGSSSGGTTTTTKYEAESASLTGVSTATSVSGYSGSGYVTGLDNTGDKVSFTVNAAAAGSYPLIIRYHNSCGACTKAQDVVVNGTTKYTNFAASASGWNDLSFGNVSLTAGNNTIAIVKNWGWTDIDYITVGASTGTGGGGGTSTAYNRVKKVGTNFWFVYSQDSQTDSWTGGYVFNQQNPDFANTSNPWSSAFLEDIKIYQVLRFMDWSGGNGDPTKNWTDRPQKHHKYQFGGTMASDSDGDGFSNDIKTLQQQDGKYTAGVAYEWLIDLCNRNQSDMWINVPYKTIDPADFPNGDDFNNEYVHKMAIMLKHGVDMKDVNLKTKVGGKANLGQLKDKSRQDFINWGGVATSNGLSSSQKIYLEYSNELWCCSRPQVKYCNQKANSIGFSGDWQYPYYGAYAEVRMFKAFRDVFGDDSRIVRVSGYQHNWVQVIDNAWNQVILSTASNRNPWGIKPHAWKWDSYVSGSPSNWYTKVDDKVSSQTDLKNWVSNKGLKFISYEGGQHLDDNAGTFARSTDAYDKYVYWLQKMYNNAGYELVCHYTHYGKWQTDNAGYGSWGAKSYVGQPVSESGKYRAIKDFVDGKKINVAYQAIENNDESLLGGVSCYPNPVSAGNPIYIDLGKAESADISIHDATGKLVYRTHVAETSETGTFVLTETRQLKGLYLVNVVSGDQRIINKVMVK